MLHHPDTYYAVIQAERAAMLKRAERRALLMEAAKRPGSAPVGVPAEPATGRWARLAPALRSLRWVLRPAHA